MHLAETQRRGRMLYEREAEVGGMWSQAKGCLGPAGAKRGKEGFFSRVPGWDTALLTLTLGFWPPEL